MKNNSFISLAIECGNIIEFEGSVREDNNVRLKITELLDVGQNVLLDRVVSEQNIVNIQDFFISLRNETGTKRIIKKFSHDENEITDEK